MGYCKDCFYCHITKKEKRGIIDILCDPDGDAIYHCSLRGDVTKHGKCSDFKPRYTRGDYRPG